MKGLLCLLLFVPAVEAATIYHCTTPAGHAVFSDQPCGADARVQALAPPPLLHSDMDVSPERQKALDQELAEHVHRERLDHIDNAIASAQRQLDAAQRQRDDALDDLAERQRKHPNVKSGRFRLERQQIERRYRDQASQLKRELSALQRDRRQAERY